MSMVECQMLTVRCQTLKTKYNYAFEDMFYIETVVKSLGTPTAFHGRGHMTPHTHFLAMGCIPGQRTPDPGQIYKRAREWQEINGPGQTEKQQGAKNKHARAVPANTAPRTPGLRSGSVCLSGIRTIRHLDCKTDGRTHSGA